MTVVVNVVAQDPRFYTEEIKWALDEVKRFFKHYGINITFIRRLGMYRPTLGYILRFTSPNGSHAQGRFADVTLSDWIKNPYLRPQLVIHELNHIIFDCPDHYAGSPVYEPTTEPCIMHSLHEFCLCENCMDKIRAAGKMELFPIIATVAAITAPIWFPALCQWLFGNNK